MRIKTSVLLFTVTVAACADKNLSSRYLFIKLSLMEDSYLCKDPFSAEGGFITLGSHCSMCQLSVCCSTECSLFYTKRFCIDCCKSKIEQFPQEIQQEILRKT
ncbi:cysteine-rich DPF motif domain-containing protein 1-like isoform X2 [Mytilus edulis]|uniref:cysteine-rich DPF motif domain-containing protein 1-like isoform X2 n=1 Tax=Mytilus edulis TaxID=6550 RepID=UPI0039EDF089